MKKWLSKFTVYETKSKIYVVGVDQGETTYRVLKIDRNADIEDLAINEDNVEYNRSEIAHLLRTIEGGNKAHGGLTRATSAWGIIGFIRFTGGHYMSIITKRSAVGLLGGHYLYHIDDTELIPIIARRKYDGGADEQRFMSSFHSLDITKTFYFSYAYDLTNTLQFNMLRGDQTGSATYNEMFVWNHHMLKKPIEKLGMGSGWCLPIIHGFIDQASISVFGHAVFVTLLARRSHYFAGARFLKRGVNDRGYVANDVETEQIVSNMTLTPFIHRRVDSRPTYTSYVQYRGSIPLFWTQTQDNISPKPPIDRTLFVAQG